ncbi:MAG: hypothetical protein ACRCUY_00655 [Thermoguttaceae bacterium]
MTRSFFTFWTILVCAVTLAFFVSLKHSTADDAQKQSQSSGKPNCDILVTGSGRVMKMNPNFEIIWEYPAGNIHEAHRLPNGNILFSDGSATEVTPEKKVVFRYEFPKGIEGTCTATRLSNGNTLVGENETGKVMEIAPDGTVAFTLQTKFETTDRHHRMRYVRKLENGNYLVCHSGDHLVREYKPAGEIVWEQKVPHIAFAAERLPNGNTMISSIDQVTEFDKDGKIVWEFKKSEFPELNISMMTGFHIRQNGNIAIGCYSAYKPDGRGVGMFEITRDKKLVWSYAKPTGERVDRNMMGIEILE